VESGIEGWRDILSKTGLHSGVGGGKGGGKNLTEDVKNCIIKVRRVVLSFEWEKIGTWCKEGNPSRDKKGREA